MDRVVALLRGVNVGGRRVSMAVLRDALGRAGCRDVATYVQSGNVVLVPPVGRRRGGLEGWLSSVIADVAGFEVGVLVRTADELRAVVEHNPYPGVEGTKLHVVFLATVPHGVLDAVDVDSFAPEHGTLRGRELYLHLPDGMGRARLPQAIEQASRRGGLVTTARNWNTVSTLLDMATG